MQIWLWLPTTSTDFEKAFYSGHRMGDPEEFQQRFLDKASLYTGSKSAASVVGACLTSFLWIQEWGRVVLAPPFLNACLGYFSKLTWSNGVLDFAVEQCRSRFCWPLTTAAVLFEIFETLVTAFNAFSNEANPLGLEISWTEIKIQTLEACFPGIEIALCFPWDLF